MFGKPCLLVVNYATMKLLRLRENLAALSIQKYWKTRKKEKIKTSTWLLRALQKRRPSMEFEPINPKTVFKTPNLTISPAYNFDANSEAVKQ
jgi:hypothetical protein